MKKENYLILLFPILFLIACNSQNKKPEEVKTEEQATESSPKEMLSQAYQLFKEGDDEGSIQLANTVLKIGKETKNDTLIGKALTSLCEMPKENWTQLDWEN